jgi:site-specific DNA-methyltransferase (adenine-specific)
MSRCFVFFGRGASFYKWGYLCQQLGFKFLEELIWDKTHLSSPFGNITRIHETISVWRKGNKQLNKVYIDKIEYLLNSENIAILQENVKRIFMDIENLKTGEDFEDWYNNRKQRKTKHNITSGEKSKSTAPYAAVLKSYQNGKVLSSIIRVNREHYTMEHPTQKPIELMDLLVKLCSNENEIIFDPFGGSGTTCVSALKEKRNYIGCEIDKEYFEIATKRIGNQEKLNKRKIF